MSRIGLIVLFIVTTIFTNAQEIPVQFALTDTAGIELPNRSIAVRTSFTSDTLAIAPEYQETQSTITNQFGIASYWIGSGITTLSSTHDNISKDWINPGSLYYIVVEVDSTGSGYQDLATIQYRFPIIALKSSQADSALFSNFTDSSYFANSSTSSTYSIYSDSTDYAEKTDSANFSSKSDSSVFSTMSVLAVNSSYADSSSYSDFSDTSYQSQYSDSSIFSQFSSFSFNSSHANNSDSANFADSSLQSQYADTSNYSLSSTYSIESGFAFSSYYSSLADTAIYALYIDSAAFKDSSNTNEIQSLEQVLSVDSNANNESIYNLKSLTIGDTLISQSAALAINRNDAGFLLPRLTKIQRDVISNPQQGLMVYCTDCENDGRVSVYDGNTWELLSQTNSSGSYAVISAGSIDNITVSGATFNGAVSDSGGTTVFAKGFCLSPNPYPSLADVVIGPDLLDSSGVFRGRADYLDRNSKYYVRAYATNAAGTVYGPQQEFLTEGLLAVGDTFGGGIVGYILQPGDNGYDPGEQHGIIVSQQNYGTSLDWGSCTAVVRSNGSTGGTYYNGRTSELVFDAAYNDSVWNTICADSLDQYQNYYSSVMHIVRDINWEGYNDWLLGTRYDYQALSENIELLNNNLTQDLDGFYWTSSAHYYSSNSPYRWYARFYLAGSTNSLTGVTTYQWTFNTDERSYHYVYLLRPIRYF